MIITITGAQYGSEGKGAIAAQLHTQDDISVRVGGSNAGHSVVDPTGRKWAFRHLPVATVLDAHSPLVIASGSEIDLEVLDQEISDTEAAGWRTRSRLLVDQYATIIEEKHKLAETQLVGHIGSTGKGNGAARADRAMRSAKRYCDVREGGHDTVWYLNHMNQLGSRILIEGTQGYGLGLHGEHYPRCTSGNCRPIDFIAQAGLAPWAAQVESWLIARTFPIRVAGNSGPLTDETTWEELGLEPERTTVTQKIRRVGGWDPEQVHEAHLHCGPSQLALTFFDYWYPELHGLTGGWEVLSAEQRDRVYQVRDDTGMLPVLLGTSDRTAIDLRGQELS